MYGKKPFEIMDTRQINDPDINISVILLNSLTNYVCVLSINTNIALNRLRSCYYMKLL